MARIPEADPSATPPEIQKLLEEQRTAYGEIMNAALISCYRPSIFLANHASGQAIEESGLLPVGLRTLLNVRVAQINGCPF